MTKYKYYRPDSGEGVDDAREFDSDWSGAEKFHGVWIAEDAAEHYHAFCDGWECSWPIELVVLREDGSELGRFEVDREAVPQFHAAALKEAKA